MTADIADPIILLHKGPEVIFEEDFSDHLEGMLPHERQKWLEDRSGSHSPPMAAPRYRSQRGAVRS